MELIDIYTGIKCGKKPTPEMWRGIEEACAKHNKPDLWKMFEGVYADAMHEANPPKPQEKYWGYNKGGKGYHTGTAKVVQDLIHDASPEWISTMEIVDETGASYNCIQSTLARLFEKKDIQKKVIHAGSAGRMAMWRANG